MATEALLTTLSQKLEDAEQLFIDIEESEALPPKVLSDYFSGRFMPLLCKDIPAEICSDTKLWERIEEVDSLINDVMSDLSQKNYRSE
jgi:hypothetical protein